MHRYMLHANGPDQAGIVAAVTEALTHLGCNLEDSRMTILRGQFSIMMTIAIEDISEETISLSAKSKSELSISGGSSNGDKHDISAVTAQAEMADSDEIKEIIKSALAEAVREFGLHISVVKLHDGLGSGQESISGSDKGESFNERKCLFVSIHGADRIGIVSRMTGKIAAVNSSIVDLATRLVANTYVLVMTVELANTISPEEITRYLSEEAETLGITCKVSSADPDLL